MQIESAKHAKSSVQFGEIYDAEREAFEEVIERAKVVKIINFENHEQKNR